jgi:hypothetical protein
MIGRCTCGTPITIGDAYKVPVKGPYTIKRPCQTCPRVNEVTLHVSVETHRATWHVTDCHCGNPLYLRKDFSGEGNGVWTSPNDYKNRTVTQYCRRCKCKVKFVVRFKTTTPGRTQRTVNMVTTRARTCTTFRNAKEVQA